MIASQVGQPIVTDQFTAQLNKPAYARVLVEVDATKPLVKEVVFQVPSGKVIKQEVIFETEPKVCMKCHYLGHDAKGCKGRNAQQRGRSKSRARREVQHMVPRQNLQR